MHIHMQVTQEHEQEQEVQIQALETKRLVRGFRQAEEWCAALALGDHGPADAGGVARAHLPALSLRHLGLACTALCACGGLPLLESHVDAL